MDETKMALRKEIETALQNAENAYQNKKSCVNSFYINTRKICRLCISPYGKDLSSDLHMLHNKIENQLVKVLLIIE